MINRRNILALAAGSLLIPNFSFGAEKKLKYELVKIELDQSINTIPIPRPNGLLLLNKIKATKEEVIDWISSWEKVLGSDMNGFLYIISYKDLPDHYDMILVPERLFLDGEIIEGLEVSNIHIDKNFIDKDENFPWLEKDPEYAEWKKRKLQPENRTPNYEYQKKLKENFNWSEWKHMIVFNYKDDVRYMTTFIPKFVKQRNA